MGGRGVKTSGSHGKVRFWGAGHVLDTVRLGEAGWTSNPHVCLWGSDPLTRSVALLKEATGRVVGSVGVASVGMGDAGLAFWVGPSGGRAWTGVTVQPPTPGRGAGCWTRTRGSLMDLGLCFEHLSNDRIEATEPFQEEAWRVPPRNGCPAREALAGLLLPGAHVPAGAVQALDSEDTSEAICPVPGRGSKGRGELPPAVTGETQLSSSRPRLAAGAPSFPVPRVEDLVNVTVSARTICPVFC